LLQQAGVLFCLQNEGDMEAMHARNIPFLAGTAVAYGLTVEQAVASVSLNTAKILGLDTQFGSLEIGKRASIFVSKGNALDPMSHQVTHIFLDGNQIPVTNRQMELYNNYMKKYKTK
jgi:imidazolonepropionase-like amidohydrolase